MKFKNIIIIAAVATAVVAGAAISANFINKNNDVSIVESNVDISKLPILEIQGSFVYDVKNKNEAVGISDYVFVGKVVSNNGTTYKNVITMEDKDGKEKEVGTPYTSYTIEVIDNIKGKLEKDSIEVLKHGGVSQDKKSVFVFEDDVLPEVNKSYIFLGYAQKDGSILISGPNSNTLVNTSDEQEISSVKEYQEYKNALQNQIIKVKRERFNSKFEE